MKTSHSTARNAAAVEKIFNGHYSQAKITAGAATRPGAHGSPTVWNELPAHTLHERAPSPSPPSTFMPPSSEKPAKKDASTKWRSEVGSRSRLFPQPTAGIEAFTDGDILAGKNIQPDWQRPSYRDIAHHGSNDRAGEAEGEGGGTLSDLDEERLGPHKSRKPLQTSLSQQEKEFRALSERLFGAAAPPLAAQPLTPEALQKGSEEEEGRTSLSAPLGVGRPVDANGDTTTINGGGDGGVSVSQGVHDPPTTLSSAPVKKHHRMGSSIGGSGGSTRGTLMAAPAAPVTVFRSTPTPPSAVGKAAWEEAPPPPHWDRTSMRMGVLQRDGPRRNGGSTPSVPPLSYEERQPFHLHRYAHSTPPAVEFDRPYASKEDEESGARASPTPLPSSAIERREREMAAEEVYPWRWRRDHRMQDILAEKELQEAKAASVRKDPHRSYSAMVNAKRQHTFFLPSTKFTTTDDIPLGAMTSAREGKGGVPRRRRTSSDTSVYRRGRGGEERAAARPYRAAPLPPCKLRQLSQQQKVQQQHEENIRRYEETLPLRRMADPYVHRAYQRRKVQDAKGVGVPNEYTLHILSDSHHGLHPIIGNTYRQQLLRGEPLIRRVLRGDFYSTAGAGEYAVPQYEDTPPSVRRVSPSPPPTTAPPALPVFSQALPRSVSATSRLRRRRFPHPTTTAAAATSSSCFAPPQWQEEGKAVLGGGGRTGNWNRSRHPSEQGDPRYDRRPRVPPHPSENDLSLGAMLSLSRADVHANRRAYKKNFLQRNKAEVQKYSDRNTQYRYYQEQMEARSKLPPRNRG